MTDEIVGYGSSGLPITASQAAYLATKGIAVAHPIGSTAASSIVSSYSGYSTPNVIATGGNRTSYPVTKSGTSSSIGSGLAPYSTNQVKPLPNPNAQAGFMDNLMKSQTQYAYGTGYMDKLLNQQTQGKGTKAGYMDQLISVQTRDAGTSGGFMDKLLNNQTGGVIATYDTNIVPEVVTAAGNTVTTIVQEVQKTIKSVTDPVNQVLNFPSQVEAAKTDITKYAILGVAAYLLYKESER